ncbi:Ssu72 protein [Capsaspora owczarzaki ATCC 30864]|uniref:RNA polymerase II subunit A C-terminal domain phosphatase SSU72 n=1 Tax=Capsaspora owczarzaki (strain ATCC 30864) TaxID=595528 RepID=A0A0D2WNJ3_CAPO3|nr:Ssu72 protein [Capsaspora owczarzaki ATCC 30864]
MGRVKYAVICSSNQNRSMEAHALLSKKGFDVCSYGSGNNVKLPGPTPDQPNVYEFNTPYNDIYAELASKDNAFYTGNGILSMLDRNRKIKTAPERFADAKPLFDVIITCEERVFDQVLEVLEARDSRTFRPVHIINIDIKDNHEEATVGAALIFKMCQAFDQADDLEVKIEEVLDEFQRKHARTLLHSIAFY